MANGHHSARQRRALHPWIPPAGPGRAIFFQPGGLPDPQGRTSHRGGSQGTGRDAGFGGGSRSGASLRGGGQGGDQRREPASRGCGRGHPDLRRSPRRSHRKRSANLPGNGCAGRGCESPGSGAGVGGPFPQGAPPRVRAPILQGSRSAHGEDLRHRQGGGVLRTAFGAGGNDGRGIEETVRAPAGAERGRRHSRHRLRHGVRLAAG